MGGDFFLQRFAGSQRRDLDGRVSSRAIPGEVEGTREGSDSNPEFAAQSEEIEIASGIVTGRNAAARIRRTAQVFPCPSGNRVRRRMRDLQSAPRGLWLIPRWRRLYPR